MRLSHKSRENKVHTFFRQEFMLINVFIFDIFFHIPTEKLPLIEEDLCLSVNSINFSSTASVKFHIFYTAKFG